MAYLGMTSIEFIDRMTLWEYDLRMKAHSLRVVDMEYRIHLQAWVGRAVNATKKAGGDKREYVYKKFDKFFNYKKRVREIDGNKSKGLSDVAKTYMKNKKKGRAKDERI